MTLRKKNKKKALLIVSSLLPGGAERVTLSLAEYLMANDYEVHLFVARIRIAGRDAYSVPDGIAVHYVGRGTENKYTRALLNIICFKILVSMVRPKWIISLGAQYKLVKLSGCLGKRNVLLSERNWPKLFYGANELDGVTKIYEKATKVVFQTQEARDCFPTLSNDKCIVIPNAVRDSLPAWTGCNSRTVAYVGRLTSQKNPKLLIEAFSIFSKRHEFWCLDIYGNGPMREELKKEVQNLGLEDSVTFYGNVQDVCERVSRSAIYVSTSNYEGISNSLLEAASMGVPIVSTDCAGGGARMIVKDGKTGFLVPCGDASAVAGAMAKLADDSSLSSQVSKNLMLDSKRFFPDTIYSKWREILS